jgi:hypothetical protein
MNDRVSRSEAALLGAGQGLSFGFSDEGAAAMRAALGEFANQRLGAFMAGLGIGMPGMEDATFDERRDEYLARYSDERSFGERYQDFLDQQRRQLAEAKEDRPGTMFAGELAGGLATGGAGAAKAVGNQALRTAATRGAAVGAGAGALAGAGHSEGSVGDRLSDAALGALIGGGMGAALPAVASRFQPAGDDILMMGSKPSVLMHGTSVNYPLKEARPSPTGWMGGGLYASRDQGTATRYAASRAEQAADGAPVVHEFGVRGKIAGALENNNIKLTNEEVEDVLVNFKHIASPSAVNDLNSHIARMRDQVNQFQPDMRKASDAELVNMNWDAAELYRRLVRAEGPAPESFPLPRHLQSTREMEYTGDSAREAFRKAGFAGVDNFQQNEMVLFDPAQSVVPYDEALRLSQKLLNPLHSALATGAQPAVQGLIQQP